MEKRRNLKRQVTQLPLLVTNLLARPFRPRLTWGLATCLRGGTVSERLEGEMGGFTLSCICAVHEDRPMMTKRNETELTIGIPCPHHPHIPLTYSKESAHTVRETCTVQH